MRTKSLKIAGTIIHSEWKNLPEVNDNHNLYPHEDTLSLSEKNEKK